MWNSSLTATSKVFTQLQLVVVGMSTCDVFVVMYGLLHTAALCCMYPGGKEHTGARYLADIACFGGILRIARGCP